MPKVFLFPWMIVAAALIGIMAPMEAQSKLPRLARAMAGVHLDYFLPTPPVKSFSNQDDWGFLVELQYRIIREKPFFAGAYYAETGMDKYVLHYTDYSSGYAVNIRERANSRRLEFGLSAGFYPEINFPVRPYVLGRVGYHMFLSSSILYDEDEDENIDRIRESKDGVFGYGLDIGFQIVPKIDFIRGDIRFGFLSNPSVTYLYLDDDLKGTVDYPIEAFREHTSATKWIKFSIGISILLSESSHSFFESDR